MCPRNVLELALAGDEQVELIYEIRALGCDQIGHVIRGLDPHFSPAWQAVFGLGAKTRM